MVSMSNEVPGSTCLNLSRGAYYARFETKVLTDWSKNGHFDVTGLILTVFWVAFGRMRELRDGCEVDYLRLVSAKFCVKTYLVKALTKARRNELKRWKWKDESRQTRSVLVSLNDLVYGDLYGRGMNNTEWCIGHPTPPQKEYRTRRFLGWCLMFRCR